MSINIGWNMSPFELAECNFVHVFSIRLPRLECQILRNLLAVLYKNVKERLLFRQTVHYALIVNVMEITNIKYYIKHINFQQFLLLR